MRGCSRAGRLARLAALGLPVPEWAPLDPLEGLGGAEGAARSVRPPYLVLPSPCAGDPARELAADSVLAGVAWGPEDLGAEARRVSSEASRAAGAEVLVVVIHLVDAVASGLAYTANPVTMDTSSILVEAVPGLHVRLRSWGAPHDSIWVSRSNLRVREARVMAKPARLSLDPASRSVAELPSGSPGSQALGDEDAVRVAAVALAAERALGGPVEVEWALDARGAVWVYDARPLAPLRS